MPSAGKITKHLNTFQVKAWKAILANSKGKDASELLDEAMIALGEQYNVGWPRSMPAGGDRRSPEAQGQQWAIAHLDELKILDAHELGRRIYDAAGHHEAIYHQFATGAHSIVTNAI